jgi:hypothetical protein
MTISVVARNATSPDSRPKPLSIYRENTSRKRSMTPTSFMAVSRVRRRSGRGDRPRRGDTRRHLSRVGDRAAAGEFGPGRICDCHGDRARPASLAAIQFGCRQADGQHRKRQRGEPDEGRDVGLEDHWRNIRTSWG